MITRREFTRFPEHPRCRCSMIRGVTVDGWIVDETAAFTKQDWKQLLVHYFGPATSREGHMTLEDKLPAGWDGERAISILMGGMNDENKAFDFRWACTVALLERIFSFPVLEERWVLEEYWFNYWEDYDDIVIG